MDEIVHLQVLRLLSSIGTAAVRITCHAPYGSGATLRVSPWLQTCVPHRPLKQSGRLRLNTPASAQPAAKGREEITAIKQEIAADVKDIRRDLGDLGQWVNSMEQTSTSQTEELEEHYRELLELQDKNLERSTTS
ncbi:hypothetical protein NDU88_005499 [Pleurodeles waltl]|uniref:Uncharacterized protein n=1 Tax=Pleurodeles waltl TaxID=8319 RepID=A0AAV7MWZ5_PLEWA|nr:hypothetical protein NDU88_005499 [Pleurodeles waltl]